MRYRYDISLKDYQSLRRDPSIVACVAKTEAYVLFMYENVINEPGATPIRRISPLLEENLRQTY